MPSIMTVHASGTPDEYGNRIVAIWVAEWNDTLEDYQSPYSQCVHLYTESGTNTFDEMTIHANGEDMILHAYTVENGFALRVYDNLKLKVIVKSACNKTLIPDPASQMRCNITISTVCTNETMTFVSYATGTNYYMATFYYIWDTAGQPVSGVTYTTSVRYEAYY